MPSSNARIVWVFFVDCIAHLCTSNSNIQYWFRIASVRLSARLVDSAIHDETEPLWPLTHASIDGPFFFCSPKLQKSHHFFGPVMSVPHPYQHNSNIFLLIRFIFSIFNSIESTKFTSFYYRQQAACENRNGMPFVNITLDANAINFNKEFITKIAEKERTFFFFFLL